MKKIILLITILSIIIGINFTCYAATNSDKFYISTPIDNVYFAKVKDGKTSYRQAKFKRRSSDKKIVYCIEPFVTLDKTVTYKGYDENIEKLSKISDKVWKKVKLLSYYGYGYKNHTDPKWYSITQILIWKEIDPEATFYWTDTLKGKKVDKYKDEINELNKLVREHDVLPSFSKKEIKSSINTNIKLNDDNKVLDLYDLKTNDKNIEINKNNNVLEINTNSVEGRYTIDLIKEDNMYKEIPIIYVSDSSQNVFSIGSYDLIKTQLSIEVGSGSLTIKKVDKDTKDIYPQGSGKLIGTVYELIDSNNTVVGELKIDEHNTANLEKIKYGKYKLKEKIAGIGYKLDNNEYEVEINETNKNIELTLEDEIIKNKIKIIKKYGDDNSLKNEKNIKFRIYDSNKKIYKEVETNNQGIVEFELEYGKYKVEQVNTTKGYNKVKSFEIDVTQEKNEEIEYILYDLKIPDTNENVEIKDIIVVVILIIFSLYAIYDEKKNNN